MRKMTKSQIEASNRIGEIDDLREELRKEYEENARHSEEHFRAWMALSNLAKEREMLVSIVVNGPIKINKTLFL